MARMLLVAMPGAPSSVLMPFVTGSEALAPSSFFLLVVRPGATGSVIAPISNALCY